VGVHGTKVTLDIDKHWSRSISKFSLISITKDSVSTDLNFDVAISMALVSTHTLPMLLELEAAGRLDASALITHGLMSIPIFDFCCLLILCTDFKFSDIEKAYDVFGRAAETGALKVNIEF